MRPDEAFYILAKNDYSAEKHSLYVSALKDIKVCVMHPGMLSNPDCFLYFLPNSFPMISFSSNLNSDCLLGNLWYEALFFECPEFTYEHYNGPGAPKEYENKLSMSSYDDLVDYILKGETDQDYFFVDPNGIRFMPAFETDTTYTWQVFVCFEDYVTTWYCVGRFTVPKS